MILTALIATTLTAVSHKKVEPPVQYANATSYCLLGTMADGSYTRHRSVAMNRLALGTTIKLVRPKHFRGLRKFVVRDRIGWGTELDFWSPSCDFSRQWGRHTVAFRIQSKG